MVPEGSQSLRARRRASERGGDPSESHFRVREREKESHSPIPTAEKGKERYSCAAAAPRDLALARSLLLPPNVLTILLKSGVGK